jgi:deaminated glutathione amidase
MATRIAIAQLQSTPDKSSNLQQALALLEEAQERQVELIAFPEFLMAFSPATQSAAELCAQAESVEGPFITTLAKAAGRCKMHVVAPIYEVCPVTERVYDSAVWIDNAGRVVTTYRKLHLYDAFGFRESDKFYAGRDVPPPISALGASFGLMICYDLRFPEMARMLALQGANVLIAPSGWVQGDLKVEHWQTMIKARALENGCFVLAPNQVGNVFTGYSMAVDPLGRTLAQMELQPGLALIDIDLSLVDEVRAKLPLLANRRSDLYADFWRHHST